MSIISRITTWTVGQILKSADINNEFNNVVNTLNNLNAASTSWTSVSTGSLTVTSGGTITAPSLTSWVSYTPTFVSMGTVTSINIFWRRVGDTLEVRGSFTVGTAVTSPTTFSLPSGLTTDATKIPVTQLVGRLAGNSNTAAGRTVTSSGNQSAMTFGFESSNGLGAYNGTAIFPVNGETVSIQFAAPITGWTF